ncbi:hypothetical protein CMI44_00530 [Candidatus Pacearchaeota archaeon]|nr:hypothetical protein [Candidatus Pacearchaeota archaeon]
MVIKNKRGWIRILEAFFVIVLITGVLLVAIGQDITNDKNSEKVYEESNSILQAIQLDKSLREKILVATSPVEWEDFESTNLAELKTFVIGRTPNYLNCSAKICIIGEDCIINQNISNNIYTSSTGIYATKDTYAPKQLKLFCWED